jgi:lipoprotein-releasing system ATP-binding protein
MHPASSQLCAEAVSHRGSAEEELRGVTIAVEPRRFTLVSGAGAGLLLRVLGLLERPEAGEVWLQSRPTRALEDAARLELRNRAFGFLFAEPFLLDSFNVAENVAMPLLKISGADFDQAHARTAQLLEFAGLASAADWCVADLDPLDRHKVSLARALANSPPFLIAEIAALDLPPRELRDFAALLRSAPESLGVSVLATPPRGFDALGAEREIRLEGGTIAADSHPIPVDA